MRRGRFFWKLFIPNAVLLAVLWASGVVVILRGLNQFDSVQPATSPKPAAPQDSQGEAARSPAAGFRDARRIVTTTGVMGFLSALGLTLGLAILWGRRVTHLTAAANALARGDWTTHLDSSGSDEMALLARSLNRMADRLSAQMATIDGQRRTLESLLATISEGVVVAGSDGRIVLLNPAAARLLNLPAETSGTASMANRTVEQCVPQHDLQRMLLPHATGAEPSLNESRLDLSTAGGPVSVLARASDIALPDSTTRPGGERKGRLLVLTDVTEFTKAIRLRTDFVANASHELRTPLSAIRAAAETLLKMNLREEHEVAPRFFHVIARHVGRLEALVSDLLDLSRLESPGGSFERTALQLHRLAGEIRQRWLPPAEEKGVGFECEVCPECTTINVNPRLLELVVDNLLDNAMKFTAPGGEVRLHVSCPAGGITVEVRDNGCGIPPEEHARVFERFYQISPSRAADGVAKERGTGLGLSIVKHAVAAMNGTVRLDSTPGKGTTVTVTLPTS